MKGILQVSAALLTLIPACAFADSVLGMYPKDSARTTYADEVEELPQPEFEYFTVKHLELEPSAKAKLSIDKAPDAQTGEKQEEKKLVVGETKPLTEKEKQKAPTEEEIIAKYGDPNKPFPVTGTEDAPVPFRGMLEALNSEKPELAKQYARQFLHYINNVKDTTQKAQALYREILAEDGLLPGSEKKEELEGEEAFDEAEARSEVRRAVANHVPVDPFGAVDIYVFLKTEDENSKLMIAEINALAAAVKDDKNIALHLLLTGVPDHEAVRKFRDASNISLPVRDGTSLARELKIETAPTTVFVTKNSRKAIVEEGYRRFFYLDEVRKVMQGKKQGAERKE